MLEHNDFIDPRLAQKLKNLQLQIARLLRQQFSIISNKKTSNQTKQKLMNYNKQCLKNNQIMLQDVKNQLIKYLDKQQLVNKYKEHCYSINLNNVNRVKNNSKEKIEKHIKQDKNEENKENIKLNQFNFKNINLNKDLNNDKDQHQNQKSIKTLSQLSFRNNIIHSDYKVNIINDNNHINSNNHNKFNRTQRLSLNSYKNQQSTMIQDKSIDNLNSTSHISKQYYRNIKNKNLQLDKQSHHSHSYRIDQESSIKCLKGYQIPNNTQIKRVKKRAKIYTYKIKQNKNNNQILKNQIQAYQTLIQSYQFGFNIIMQQKSALQLKFQESQQVLKLQQQKIKMIYKKCQSLQKEKQSIQIFYKKQINEVLNDHNELKKIQQQNKALLMERNLLLKKINNR